jgi:hypothetical protein
LWVFLGGLTAGAALIVAKQSWLRPRGRLIGATGVLGLAGLGLLVAVILNAVLPSPYAVESMAWKSFSPPNGGYSVSMPGTPLRGRPTGFGGPAVVDQSESYSVELKPQQCIFMVRQEPLNNVGLGGGGNANQAINNAFNQLQLNNSYGSYSYYNAFLLQRNVPVAAPSGGGQGRDVLYKVTNSHDGTRWLAARIFVSGDKLYTLTALGPKFYDDLSGKPNADVARFFNSFQLTSQARSAATPRDIPGLIAYWSFDDGVQQGDGLMLRDDANPNHIAVLHNVQPIDDGARGKALRFNGVTSAVDIGNSSDFTIGPGAEFAIAGWVRTTATRGAVVSNRAELTGAPVIDVTVTNAGLLVAQVRPDGAETDQPVELGSRAPITDGRWHHFALMRRAGFPAVIDLFIDGELRTSGHSPTSGDAITTDLRALGYERYWAKARVGLDPAYFLGDIDEFCIFNRALTEAEVKKLAGVGP